MLSIFLNMEFIFFANYSTCEWLQFLWRNMGWFTFYLLTYLLTYSFPKFTLQ